MTRFYAGIRRRQDGLTLLEIMIAMFILSLLIVSASSFLANSYRNARRIKDETTGMTLATGLMEEITLRRWDESTDAASSSLGKDAGETAGDKTDFDDIDDFNGYEESPPSDPLGNELEELVAYRRSVTVRYVDEDLDPSSARTVRKQVTVTSFIGSDTLTQITTIVTAKRDI